MDPLLWCAGLGLVFVLGSSFVTRLKFFRQKYERMGESDLSKANVKAELFWKLILAASYVVPLPLSLVVVALPKTYETLGLCLMILLIMGGVGVSGIWLSIANTTKAELLLKTRSSSAS